MPNNSSKRTRRAIPLLIAGMGVILAVSAVMEIWIGRKAERVADLVRPEMTDAGLAQHRRDFEASRVILADVEGELFPLVAAELGMSEVQFVADIDAGYPAIARLLDEKQAILTLGEQGISNLERQQRDFERADSMSITGGAITGFAVATILAQAFSLSRSPGSRRGSLGVVLLTSFVLATVTLAFGVPWKAQSAQNVLDSLNPGTDVVERTESAFDTASAASNELNDKLIPDLAAALGISEFDFTDALAVAEPELAAALTEMPDVLDRYEVRVAIRSGGAPEVRTLKEIPVGVLGWFRPAFGLVLGAIAVAGILLDRGDREVRPSDEATV